MFQMDALLTVGYFEAQEERDTQPWLQIVLRTLLHCRQTSYLLKTRLVA